MNEESNPRIDRLLRLAESVSEGETVDWDSETGLDLRAAGAVAGLRDLSAVIAAHRGLGAPKDAPPARRRPPAGTPRRWGPLRIEDKVGQGLSGEVHAAVREADGARALLFLRRGDWDADEAMSAAFTAECARLAAARHPHLVPVLGGGVHDGRLGVFTEDVSGTSLEERLIVSGPPAPGAVQAVAVALVGVLRALHAAGHYGIDLRPGRILERGPLDPLLLELGRHLELPPGRELPTPAANPEADLASLARLVARLAPGAGSASTAAPARLPVVLEALYRAPSGTAAARQAVDDLGAALGARAAS